MSKFRSYTPQHPELCRRMPHIIMTLALCAALISPAFARSSFESHGITILASTIDGTSIGNGSVKVTAEKQSYFKFIDQTVGSFFEAESENMSVIIGPAEGNKGALKSADLKGPVKIVYTVKDKATGNRTITTATADNATYNGATQTACLVGNVKIVSDDPLHFEEPAVMTGDRATLVIKPTGPDVRVESDSPKLSRIEATPKKEATQK